jgi:hypothetical protein
MKKLSHKAIAILTGSNLAIGRMMVEFDRCEKTIKGWFINGDRRLALPEAIEIMTGATGLSKMDLFEQEPAAVN